MNYQKPKESQRSFVTSHLHTHASHHTTHATHASHHLLHHGRIHPTHATHAAHTTIFGVGVTSTATSLSVQQGIPCGWWVVLFDQLEDYLVLTFLAVKADARHVVTKIIQCQSPSPRRKVGG